ncbi:MULTISPECIES: hypothetical protein [unclassified Caballeronia]|uniref:hypothetical protein n=1 Tax=unclassified Caballeronia TaxID=2646786 RepID=UPI00285E4AC9|nr:MULTISPECIES: hypothetical protein [unclassified Caballeronia]MDR5740292.1 hypothetical protein [Caballeronia sp. LZ016]MDR5808528.1 hypothetical protein [Caballeronia sp. LZ019]
MDFATTVGTIVFFAVVALALLAAADVLLPSRRRHRRGKGSDEGGGERSSGLWGLRGRMHKSDELNPKEAGHSSRSGHHK